MAALCMLFGTLCSQASARGKRDSETCKHGYCSPERKEFSRAEEECILFGTSCSQASPRGKRNSEICKHGHCSSERKELSPAEKECIADVRTFVFSYEIISGMHRRYAKEFGNIPAVVHEDLKEADAAYNAFKAYVGSSRVMAHHLVDIASVFLVLGFGTPYYALGYCDKMYNKEMNDMFGSSFSPVSDDVFLGSNWVCHTSYKDAVENVRRILDKYKNGHKCE